MINTIITILGEYTPLNGEGIASINPVWIVAAIFLVMSVWVVYKIILKFFDWMLK